MARQRVSVQAERIEYEDALVLALPAGNANA
jgi:hypothetical protein